MKLLKNIQRIRPLRYIATICYILFIILINTLFVTLPGIAAFGESFSPADFVLGGIYLLRDFAQREIKHKVIIAMLVGTGLSYLLADKTIAIASVSAFTVGETIDWAIYTFTKRPLSQRLLWSSALSSPIDTVVFLGIAGRLHWLSFSIMTLGKMGGVLLLWGYWKWRQSKHLKSVETVPFSGG